MDNKKARPGSKWQKGIYMERYDYYEAVRKDVIEAIRNNYSPEEIREALEDRDAFHETLHDELWIDDSVTGNASGSYYCNTWKAEEAIAHNLDLLGEALQEFGCGPEYLIEKGVEAADVTIRCYLLGPAISEALDELEAEEDGETMINIIYDTLFNNKQFEQFNAENAEEQILDYSENSIEFKYNGKPYKIKIIEE